MFIKIFLYIFKPGAGQDYLFSAPSCFTLIKLHHHFACSPFFSDVLRNIMSAGILWFYKKKERMASCYWALWQKPFESSWIIKQGQYLDRSVTGKLFFFKTLFITWLPSRSSFMLTELKITCLTGDLYRIKGTLPKLFYFQTLSEVRRTCCDAQNHWFELKVN